MGAGEAMAFTGGLHLITLHKHDTKFLRKAVAQYRKRVKVGSIGGCTVASCYSDKLTESEDVGVIEVVPRLDLDEEVKEDLLDEVDGDSRGQTDQRVDRKQEPLFLVRLRDEDGQPGVQGQVHQPGRDELRPRSFWKVDDDGAQERDWPD